MAEWSRERLERVARASLAKREGLQSLEAAALAYARWKGLTHETGLDREAQRHELDRQLDLLDQGAPDVWKRVPDVAQELGDEALQGLMAYSLNRSREQLRIQAKSVSKGQRRERERDR